MHLEILVEDLSGEKMLEILVPKIIDDSQSKINRYDGIGTIPKGLKNSKNAAARHLLNQLPRLLKGYGKTFSRQYNFPSAVIVVCDLDDKDLETFVAELEAIAASCNPSPTTCFCIAVEEGEAWFLGDKAAIRAAYPKCRQEILNSYAPDFICGTWQKLADAVYKGGSRKLHQKSYSEIGAEKRSWAEQIAPKMNVDDNSSPSFCRFRDKLRSLTR